MGRFGNQLFQYAFCKAYAESIGEQLRTNEWIGQKLFDINDPLCVADYLPQVTENNIPVFQNRFTNIEPIGYFQHEFFLNYYSRKWCLETFKFNDNILEAFRPPRQHYIACHLRVGDYAKQFDHIYCIVEKENYVRQAAQLGYSEDEIIWISEESPHFQDSLATEPAWLTDFLIMKHADILLRANSTFSWWAGTLNEKGKVYSPVVENKVGSQNDIEFVDGNHSRMMCPSRTEFGLHSELRLKDV